MRPLWAFLPILLTGCLHGPVEREVPTFPIDVCEYTEPFGTDPAESMESPSQPVT